jgi:hypothetical protein
LSIIPLGTSKDSGNVDILVAIVPLVGGGRDMGFRRKAATRIALLVGAPVWYPVDGFSEYGMEHAIQIQLVALGDEIRSAAIPDTSKRTALWCVDKLPTLYAKFRLTYESRYGEEIARLVQGALTDLVSGPTASPATQELAASMNERLRLLHEQSGIPALNLKPLRPAPPRARKIKR